MTDLLRIILNGNSFADDQAIYDVALSQNIDLKAEAYTCVVICHDGKVHGSASYHRRYVTMPQRCENYFRKQGSKVLVTCNASGDCVVVLLGQISHGRLDKWLNELHAHLQRHHFENVCIGAGDTVTELSKLHESYAAARNALLYHTADAEIAVHYTHNIRMIYNTTTLQSSAEMNEILNSFRAGDLEQVRQLAAQCAEKVRMLTRRREGDPYPTSIKRMFIELTVHVLHIASDAGVNVDEQLEHLDPYSYLMSMTGTPRILDWFMSMCEKMRQGIDEKTQVKESGIVLRACEYIQQHLSEYDLSLETVSNYVNITPSYFSTLFHKEVGVGFSSYTGKARIEAAKILLKTTALSTGEIADQVGFTSVNYFTRVFKKTVGMPPGQYRKAE